MSTQYFQKKFLLAMVALFIFFHVHASQAYTVPSGFSEIKSATGVKVYKKDYAEGSPDYVMVIDLSQAEIHSLTGSIEQTNSSCNSAYSLITKQSLSGFWSQAQREYPNAFAVFDGAFGTGDDPTGLAHSLEKDGRYISYGYESNEKPEGDVHLLEINNDTDWINVTDFSGGEFCGAPIPDMIGGFDVGVRYDNIRPDDNTGRTYVGVSDENGNGNNDTVFVLASAEHTTATAKQVLESFGITAAKQIMFDGGGSTQLIIDGTTYIAGDGRKLPHYFAVVAGESSGEDSDFELDSNTYTPGSDVGTSHIYWPFPDSEYLSPTSGTDDWYVACGPGCGFHWSGDYFSDDWNWGDSASSDCGVDFYSPLDGTVIFTGTGAEAGYGNQVVVQSSDNSNFAFRVAHLQTVSVSKGQTVSRGIKLGEIGKTGDDSYTCHAHAVLYRNISQIYSGSQTALDRLKSGDDVGLSSGVAGNNFSAAYYLDAGQACPPDNDCPNTTTYPNLTPYRPATWSDKIVVSTTTGTNTDSSALKDTDTLYVDWAVANDGDASTTTTFNSYLYIDGVLKQIGSTPSPLNPTGYAYIQDYSPGSLSAGSHTLEIVADATSVIPESNESDNRYTKTINVESTTYTLLVSTSGSGTVTSNDSKINCGLTCSATYTSGSVTLTASPSSGWTFVGWGGNCSGTGSCSLTMNGNKSVTATFQEQAPQTYTLSVSKSGTGDGTITSYPSGISCGSGCPSASTTFSSGQSVTLTASADSNSRFVSWSGDSDCSDGSVAMNGNRSCAATFNTRPSISFNEEISSGGTVSAKVSHIQELRNAINLVRVSYGLSTWSDEQFGGAITTGGAVAAVHFTKMQAALKEINSGLSFSSIGSGSRIDAQHINELRQAVLNLQ